MSIYTDPECGGVWINTYNGYDKRLLSAVGLSPREARIMAARLMEYACHEEAFNADLDAYFRKNSNVRPF